MRQTVNVKRQISKCERWRRRQARKTRGANTRSWATTPRKVGPVTTLSAAEMTPAERAGYAL